MKNRKKNKIYLYILIILGITVGFALLSTTLNITGIAGINKNTWNIHWDSDSVNVNEGSIQAATPTVAGTNEDTVSFDVELELPGDYFEFDVDAINEGTIDGKISLISTIIYKVDGETETTLPDYIHYSVKNADGTTPQPGDVLKAGKSKTYKIRIEWDDESSDTPEHGLGYKAITKIIWTQDIKKNDYEKYDKVFYNPVEAKFCDEYDLDNNCELWYVLSNDEVDNKYELVLGTDIGYWNTYSLNSYSTKYIFDPSIAWRENNDSRFRLIDSWSNTLSITNEEKAKYTSKHTGYQLDFTNNETVDSHQVKYKARFLLEKEVDSTLASLLKCDYNCVVVSLDENNEATYSTLNSDGTITANNYPLDYLGSLNQMYIRPVIEVAKEHKPTPPTGSNKVYTIGDDSYVFYNPTTGTKCTQQEAEANHTMDEDRIVYTGIKDGCMKWHPITVHDTNGRDKIDLFLDHNISADLGITGPSSVEVLNTVKSSLSNLNWKEPARLITSREIAKIMGEETFDNNTGSTKPGQFNYGTYYLQGWSGTSQSGFENSNKLFLINNLADCSRYNCSHVEYQTSRYITDSLNYPSNTDSPYIWYIDSYNASLQATNAGLWSSIGVRPVITVNKSKLD